ncbi:MAG: RdgB/HAM1 family non-canonical purine NTP pyrophosphatase, partial [Bacteroidia bacterium]|nr:RdgB/HAM1 family non-canonical purine NTP pyrophosphatase [Bacteroidia bacterium]
MELVFASRNQHKLLEIQAMLPKGITLKLPSDFGIHEDIPETADTLKGNAFLKATYIFEKTGLNCFADDSGLEVEALDNAPGVYSARYAGEQKNNSDNIDLLLKNIELSTNRNASFKTVICLIINGNAHYFEGEVKGKIIDKKRGTSGFGYDPVFMPDGFNTTFGEMTADEKNNISHRKQAIKKMAL